MIYGLENDSFQPILTLNSSDFKVPHCPFTSRHDSLESGRRVQCNCTVNVASFRWLQWTINSKGNITKGWHQHQFHSLETLHVSSETKHHQWTLKLSHNPQSCFTALTSGLSGIPEVLYIEVFCFFYFIWIWNMRMWRFPMMPVYCQHYLLPSPNTYMVNCKSQLWEGILKHL